MSAWTPRWSCARAVTESQARPGPRPRHLGRHQRPLRGCHELVGVPGEGDGLADHAHELLVLGLADALGHHLRTQDEVGRAVTLTVRYADHSATSRTRKLAEPAHHTPELVSAVHVLYASLGLQRAHVRQFTVGAEQLGPDEQAHQLLPDLADDKKHRLEKVADAARAKFGTHVIQPTAFAPAQGSACEPQRL
ncbi:hypothetical protein V2W30_39865 (plasmid) [Streptomyces sp. Q6]|uniref:Uncharacterized protein n=1 Tax=Streptomyces citrinus TaxID=3118173 RepID=A0ACD5AQ70_9ACTN